MQPLRVTGLFAAGSLLVFGLGCPPEEPEPDPPEEFEYDVQMVGENQVPPVATPAEGEIDVQFEDETLTLNGEFDGLVAELTEIDGAYAHVHEGTDDEDGPILYNIQGDDFDAADDMRSGTFEFEQRLTEEEVRMLNNNELYVNIHTEAYPGGELRAQLDEDAPEFEPVDDSWGVNLTPEAHTHDPDTTADGWVWTILRDDETVVSSGAAHNLTSEVTEVTIEAAPEDEVGDVVFTYEHEMVDPEEVRDDDQDNQVDDNQVDEDVDEYAVRFWLTEEFDEDQIGVLEDGHYYVNVITEEHEDGELRAQIDDDAGFWENLFGTEEELEEAPPF